MWKVAGMVCLGAPLVSARRLSAQMVTMKIETHEDNVAAAGACERIEELADCESYDNDRDGVGSRYEVQFPAKTLFSCSVGWVCESSPHISREPCAEGDRTAAWHCLPLNRYRCMLGKDGLPVEECQALKKQAVMQSHWLMQEKLALAKQALKEKNLRAAQEPQAMEAVAEEPLFNTDEVVWEGMSMETLRYLEGVNLAAGDRFKLGLMREQLLRQQLFCLSTCVACVKPPQARREENEAMEDIEVTRTVFLERGKTKWEKAVLGASGLMLASLGGTVGGWSNGLSTFWSHAKQGHLGSAAVLGTWEGMKGTYDGALEGATLGADLAFTTCNSIGFTVSSPVVGSHAEQVTKYSRHEGGMYRWAEDVLETQDQEEASLIDACMHLTSKIYDPKLLEECMGSRTMCGEGTVPVPLPVSSERMCHAVASDAETAQEELKRYALVAALTPASLEH